MENDEAKARGAALRGYLLRVMAAAGVRSFAELARRAGIRENTIVEWWSKGKVPSNDSLGKIARALGLPGGASDLIAAYEGRRAGPGRFVTDADLEAMLARVAETAARRVLEGREGYDG